MVHFEHAESALTAMVSSLRFPCLFSSAFFAIFHIHVLTLERWCHSFYDSARVCECRAQMTEVGKEAKAIEGNEIEQAFKGQWNSLDKLLVNIWLTVPIENIGPVRYVLPKSYQQ